MKRSLLSMALLATLFSPSGEATVTVSDCSAPSGAPGRLVEIIAAAAAGDTVVFACSGTITLTATIPIVKNLDLDGAGQSVTISGGNTVRVFTVIAGVTFKLQNLTVANGAASGSNGGGVYNSGAMDVTNVTFSGNSATYGGGGIYNSSTGTLDVTNSAFSGNTATYGGGISNPSAGTSNVMNSTFSGNSATSDGGGFYNYSGTANVTNSNFFGNTATYGGGINNRSTSTLNVWNSTFSGNSATDGGGIYNYGNGTSTVTNVTFSGNSATSEAGSLYNYSGATMNVKKHHRCQHPRERKLHWHDHQWRR